MIGTCPVINWIPYSGVVISLVSICVRSPDLIAKGTHLRQWMTRDGISVSYVYLLFQSRQENNLSSNSRVPCMHIISPELIWLFGKMWQTNVLPGHHHLVSWICIAEDSKGSYLAIWIGNGWSCTWAAAPLGTSVVVVLDILVKKKKENRGLVSNSDSSSKSFHIHAYALQHVESIFGDQFWQDWSVISYADFLLIPISPSIDAMQLPLTHRNRLQEANIMPAAILFFFVCT